MAHGPVLTLALLGTVVLTFILLGLSVWLWGVFLDKYEHDPGQVRAVMLSILASAMAIEMGLAGLGITCPWVIVLSLVVDVWGGMDAVLRYPAAHDPETTFAVKQFVLLIFKTFGYAFGIRVFSQHVGTFLMMLLLNIWGLPVLYLMASPLDPCEQVVKDNDCDVDLLVRVWRLATSARERHRFTAACRGWWYRRLVVVSECSTMARFAICAASPECRRTLKRNGRCV